MKQIAIISDTHIPSREDEIPSWVADRVRAADHTIHAGDFDDPEAYEAVADLAGEQFTAVTGNMDPASLDLPESTTVDTEGITFIVTHGTARTGEEYVAAITEAIEAELEEDRQEEKEAIAVAGHTHDLADDEIAGVRFLNPGSATGADPAETETMLEVEVADGEVAVTVYEEDEEIEIER